MERIYILLSIPKSFRDKFAGFLKNLNIVNAEGEPPVIIESIYGNTKDYAAIPKSDEEVKGG